MSKKEKTSPEDCADADAVSTAADGLTRASASRARLKNTKLMRKAREIPVSRIRPDPEQHRKIFEQEPLEELAASIVEHGVLHPITVEYVESEDYYRLKTLSLYTTATMTTTDLDSTQS